MPGSTQIVPLNTTATLAVAGAGGNIGSHLLVHLARLATVARLVLIDPDRYEIGNLSGQDITRADVGRMKVAVQGKRLLRINPDLQVVAIADIAQNVPPGLLHANAILSGLDSRRARMDVARIAWHLGIPFIDAGVRPADLLARVNVYLPSSDAACFECAFSPADYAALEQVYPCQNGKAAAATDGPSSLGALAAALQATECAKLLSGAFDQLLAGRQVILDAAHHRHYITSFLRNPDCRFDHEIWKLTPAPPPSEVSIGDFLTPAKLVSGGRLRAIGHKFVHKVVCSSCGRLEKVLRLSGRPRHRRCLCGHRMSAAGFHISDALDGARLAAAGLSRRLDRLGFLLGDIVAVEHAGSDHHFELGGS